jgi:hypothetical protein
MGATVNCVERAHRPASCALIDLLQVPFGRPSTISEGGFLSGVSVLSGQISHPIAIEAGGRSVRREAASGDLLELDPPTPLSSRRQASFTGSEPRRGTPVPIAVKKSW